MLAGLPERVRGVPEIPVHLQIHPEFRDVSNRRAKRSAVSAVMPRLPRMISFNRLSGIFIRRAAST